MSASSSNREEYAVTIVSYVLSWYNQIARGYTEARVILESAQARGGYFLKGEAQELSSLLTEVRVNMEGFTTAYVNKEDAKSMETMEAKRQKVEIDPAPESQYGNQEATNRYITWAKGETEALRLRLEELREKVMVKNKWFDLKGFRGFEQGPERY